MVPNPSITRRLKPASTSYRLLYVHDCQLFFKQRGSVCTNNYCKLPGAVGGLYFSSFQHRLDRGRKCLFEGKMVKQHGQEWETDVLHTI